MVEKNTRRVSEDLVLREAESEDLERVVSLYLEDEYGSYREDPTIPVNPGYKKAFGDILEDKNNRLIVAEKEGTIVGTLQVTFIPSLSYKGGCRCHIEGVMVGKRFRGMGAGKKLIEHAISLAAERGCVLLQLTSNKKRERAIKFYRDLGFEDSHQGFKMHI